MKKVTFFCVAIHLCGMSFSQTETYVSETGGVNAPVVYIEANYQYDPCIYTGPGNAYENGKSCTQNLGRIVANDLTVLQTEEMTLESIRASLFIGPTGSGVNAAFVDLYVYDDAGGSPGDVIAGDFSIVPTSQVVTGTNFGFDVWDVVIDFDDIELPGGGGAPITYWIGFSAEATDGSNLFWENSTADVIGYGEGYNDGTGSGYFIDENLEGVYDFIGDCRLLGVEDHFADRLKLYPNPSTHGIVNIETAVPGEKQVIVFDILGKKVMEIVLDDTQLVVSSLKGGLYVVKVTQNDATAVRKLIVE